MAAIGTEGLCAPGASLYRRRDMRKRDAENRLDAGDEEALADLSTDEAAQAERLGECRKSEVLRDLARRHRVQAIQEKALRGARRR